MHALTLDHLTGGRVVLGMGVSGPQVVEGWYGQPFAKPLARTREVVDIIRQVLAREAPVTNDGPHYPLPLHRRGVAWASASRSSRSCTRCAPTSRSGSAPRGPKNVAQTAEIADGWIPIFYTPKSAGMYQPWLDEGFARPGARRTRADFEIAATCHLQVVSRAEEKAAVIDAMRPVRLALHGRHGREGDELPQPGLRPDGLRGARRARCRSSTSNGEKDRATALIPDELVDDMHIIGTAGEVQGAGRAVGGDRRDHAAAQPALARRGARDRGAAGLAQRRPWVVPGASSRAQ